MSLHIILFHQVSFHHSSSTSPRALSFQWWFILFITTVYVATSWTLTIPPLTMALIWYRFDFALFTSCLQLFFVMNVCWPQSQSRCLFVFLTVPLFPLLTRPCAGDWRRIVYVLYDLLVTTLSGRLHVYGLSYGHLTSSLETRPWCVPMHGALWNQSCLA